MKITLRPAAFALAVAALFTTAQAAELSPSDKMFVVTAARGGMTEVTLGKMASEKSPNPKIKEFGLMMVADHTKAGDELRALGQKDGFPIPAKLNKKQAKAMEDLAKLPPEGFDKEYVAQMVKDHEATIAEFEKAAKSAENPDLKAFAENTLPTLKTHLEKIQAIAKSM